MPSQAMPRNGTTPMATVTATITRTLRGTPTGPPNGPESCFPRPMSLTPSRLTEPNTWTATAIGWATTPTATVLTSAPIFGAIRNTTGLVALTPTATVIPTPTPPGRAPPIASVLTPSPPTPPSGAMKTTTALAATPRATTPMTVPRAPAPHPSTE